MSSDVKTAIVLSTTPLLKSTRLAMPCCAVLALQQRGQPTRNRRAGGGGTVARDTTQVRERTDMVIGSPAGWGGGDPHFALSLVVPLEISLWLHGTGKRSRG